MRMALLAVFTCLLCSCGSYDTFAMPKPGPSAALEFNWKPKNEPVIERGKALDVLNPSVVAWRGEYLNLYSRFDGKSWDTMLASSKDGIVWTGNSKVLSPSEAWEGTYIAANGGVAVHREQLLYAYQAGEKGHSVIGIASSVDGRNWNKHSGAVLGLGPRMSWDEISIGDPYLLSVGDEVYLFYLGEDRARRQRLGIAKSKDGTTWTKLRGGPLLELGGAGDFDENGLGEPAVFAANNQWVMIYTGRDRKEQRAMGYAVSKDGKTWEKQKEPVLRGTSAWNKAVVCDATVVMEAGRARIWFGGGDLPKPDERLNGQIGYAELSGHD